jgi:hypothetical protein
MISMRENVSDIGITPGLCLGLPAMAGVRSKTGFSSPRAEVISKQGERDRHRTTAKGVSQAIGK